MASLEIVADGKFSVADEGLEKLRGEAVVREVSPADLEVLRLGLDEHRAGRGTSRLQPHRIVAPVSAEFQHPWRVSQDVEHLLEDEFLQRFVHATVDDQDVGEGAVVGVASARRHFQSVVKSDSAGVDRSRERMPSDQEVQRIRGDLPESSEKVVARCLGRCMRHRFGT